MTLCLSVFNFFLKSELSVPILPSCSSQMSAPPPVAPPPAPIKPIGERYVSVTNPNEHVAYGGAVHICVSLYVGNALTVTRKLLERSRMTQEEAYTIKASDMKAPAGLRK
jgi:hypothetical protein